MPNPAMIVLKCPQCGAPMRMEDEITALCDHCGIRTLLPAVRDGADVRRMAEASAGTHAAADKIAAELALPRLRAKRADCERRDRELRKGSRTGLIGGGLFLGIFVLGGGLAGYGTLWMVLLLPVAGAVALGYGWLASRALGRERDAIRREAERCDREIAAAERALGR